MSYHDALVAKGLYEIVIVLEQTSRNDWEERYQRVSVEAIRQISEEQKRFYNKHKKLHPIFSSEIRSFLKGLYE